MTTCGLVKAELHDELIRNNGDKDVVAFILFWPSDRKRFSDPEFYDSFIHTSWALLYPGTDPGTCSTLVRGQRVFSAPKGRQHMRPQLRESS